MDPSRPEPAVIDAGGQSLSVRRYGRGERRLMMLHGGPGLDHHILLPLADRLAERYQVWLPDLPGHGGSLRHGENLPGVDSMRNRMSAWLTGLAETGAGPRILCGHSLGAWLARDLVRLGAAAPEGLVLLSPPSRPARGEPSDSVTEFGRAREEWLRYLQIEVPGPMSPGFRQAALDTAIVPPSRYIRLLRTLQRVFMNRPEPFDPGCPVLVLAGELDRTTTPEQAEEIARSTGGARLQRLPNCGHFSWAEDTGPTANAILDFLGEQQPKP
jgi:pimeloyl-ACP methyl ester carboxylesterase